jgi:broad specificity phosphatase PhoE
MILVRHGETDLNQKHRVRGWSDIPLNEHGLAQAEKLGKELQAKGVDVICSSNLCRATKTAEIISHHVKAPIIITEGLRPWNVGEHTGQESDKVAPILEDHAKNKPDVPLKGGESFHQFKDRFLQTVQAIRDKFSGQKTALITHHRGDMILKAWEKVGMSADHKVDLSAFLDWKKGIEPGELREVKLGRA